MQGYKFTVIGLSVRSWGILVTVALFGSVNSAE